MSGCMWHSNDYIGYAGGSGYVVGVVYMVAYIGDGDMVRRKFVGH